MKKLTTSVLAVVLSSSFVVVDAQKKVRDTTTKTQDIEGVVVTALGVKREKKSLGFASQEIKANELAGGTTNTGNIADLMAGKAAGVQINSSNNFGGSTNILIRGVKTLQGSTPLIVIDGSPVNNSMLNGANFDLGNALSDINQEDIESVNILKGAAASALYGERGLNGVIVITTKSGRGKDDGSWGVTIHSSVQAGTVDKSTFAKYQNKYGAGYDPSFYYGSAPDGKDYVNFGEDASWGPKFDPNLMVYSWESFDPTSSLYGKATPWVAAKNNPIKFFDTAFSFNNSISLEKGTKTNNFALTYDNMTSNGIMPNSKIDKNTLSLKINNDLTSNLHATIYSTLTLQKTIGRNETNYSDNIVTGFRQWWQTNVDILSLRDAYLRNIAIPSAANNYGNVTWNRVDASDGTPIFWNNPYFQRYQSYESDDRTRSFSYAQLKYDFNKNFNLIGKVSYDLTNLLIENRLAVGSLAQAFGASGKDVSSGYANQKMMRSETNYDLMFNYKFDITNDINVLGLIGGNIRRNHLDSEYASTEGGLVIPNIYSLSNSKGAVLAPAETFWTTQTNSGYATASLDIKKIFYVDGTYRIDQSSTLPANHNVYKYGSITGSVILSELIKQPWLSFWKLRGNYAETGGTADPYSLYNTYASAGLYDSSVGIYGSITTKANSELRPQRLKEFELGTEMNFFKNRINLDFAYYNSKTIDQIISSLSVSSGSGYLAHAINAGEIDNKGYEVHLGLVPVKSKDFTWNIDTNWSKNISKVVALDGTTSNYLLASYQGGISINARVGEAWGTIVGSDYVYLNGQPVISATTGRYLKNSNQVIGNVMPEWLAGVRNSLKYKDFSMSFLIDIRRGGDVFSLDQYYGLATGLYPETADYRESGTIWPGVNPNGQTNTTVTINPSAFGSLDGYARMPNKRFVYDGSFVKLREASIGYSLPKSVLDGTFLREAKISLVGRNLWIIHKNVPYADPEATLGGSILRSYGFQSGVQPTTRNIGVDFTFKF